MTDGLKALVSVALLLASLGMAGCASEPEQQIERPVEDIYNTALDLLQAGDAVAAAREFEEVERQHPYSRWATQAQLMAAFAHYDNDDYDSAILAAERFIGLHPGHEDVAYAYYLVARCYYAQISDVERDQSITEQAHDALQEVVRLFADTRYGRDAQLKIELTRDQLAGKEMAVGRWYQSRRQYVAAANRFRIVTDRYQTTSHVPEALLRLVETYLALGVVAEARNAAAVLGHNFPGSPWYRDAYALLARNRLVPGAGDGAVATPADG